MGIEEFNVILKKVDEFSVISSEIVCSEIF